MKYYLQVRPTRAYITSADTTEVKRDISLIYSRYRTLAKLTFDVQVINHATACTAERSRVQIAAPAFKRPQWARAEPTQDFFCNIRRFHCHSIDGYIQRYHIQNFDHHSGLKVQIRRPPGWTTIFQVSKNSESIVCYG